MMIAGCFGLVRACAARIPAWRGAIDHALSGGDGVHPRVV
jgi:hypothetical protein